MKTLKWAIGVANAVIVTAFVSLALEGRSEIARLPKEHLLDRAMRAIEWREKNPLVRIGYVGALSFATIEDSRLYPIVVFTDYEFAPGKPSRVCRALGFSRRQARLELKWCWENQVPPELEKARRRGEQYFANIVKERR